MEEREGVRKIGGRGREERGRGEGEREVWAVLGGVNIEG